MEVKHQGRYYFSDSRAEAFMATLQRTTSLPIMDEGDKEMKLGIFKEKCELI